jgi:hypothetical protein
LKWIKPSPEKFKCNVDAAFSQARNRVGIGVCIRYDEGRYVLAKTEWMTPLFDVDLGEALGLLSAMYWVCYMQLGTSWPIQTFLNDSFDVFNCCKAF